MLFEEALRHVFQLAEENAGVITNYDTGKTFTDMEKDKLDREALNVIRPFMEQPANAHEYDVMFDSMGNPSVRGIQGGDRQYAPHIVLGDCKRSMEAVSKAWRYHRGPRKV